MTDHLAVAREAKRRICAETFHKIEHEGGECMCGEVRSEGSWFEDGLRWRKRRADALSEPRRPQ